MNIVWLDVETTGSDPLQSTLLEVALVTNNARFHRILKRNTDYLLFENDHVKEMHTKNGLLDAVNGVSSRRQNDVLFDLRDFINGYCEGLPVGGRNIDFDLRVLAATFGPRLINLFDYHRLDISSIRYFIRNTLGENLVYRKPEEPTHRALDCIADTIREYKHYQTVIRSRPPQGA